MDEYYYLSYIRRPEFLGGTRVEESDTFKYNRISDMPWTDSQIYERLEKLDKMDAKVERIFKGIEPMEYDAFLQLVKYQIQASVQMNKKYLYAQLARHGKVEWELSDMAHDSIQRLTDLYNNGYYNDGKWKYIMSCNPRELPVFKKVPRSTSISLLKDSVLYDINCLDSDMFNDSKTFRGLGYSKCAYQLDKGDSLVFIIDKINKKNLKLEACFVPTHPVDSDSLRLSIRFDGKEENFSINTVGRSEEWKQNVTRNLSLREFFYDINKNNSRHKIVLYALDNNILFDKLLID